jgi:hypothetical protein
MSITSGDIKCTNSRICGFKTPVKVASNPVGIVKGVNYGSALAGGILKPRLSFFGLGSYDRAKGTKGLQSAGLLSQFAILSADGAVGWIQILMLVIASPQLRVARTFAHLSDPPSTFPSTLAWRIRTKAQVNRGHNPVQPGIAQSLLSTSSSSQQ